MQKNAYAYISYAECVPLGLNAYIHTHAGYADYEKKKKKKKMRYAAYF